MKNYHYPWLVIIGLIVLFTVILPGTKAQAAVGYRASATTCNATANTTVAVPAGTVNGDVMIMVINSRDNAPQSTPTGWTRIGTQLNNGTGLTTSIFYRVANSEPASYTPITTAVSHCLGISSFSGVNTANPINTFSQRTNLSSSTITATAVTPSVANTQIIFISGYASNVTHGSYSGSNPTFTEHFDANTSLGSNNTIALASGSKSNTTSTGNRTAFASGTGSANNGYLIALAPAPSVPVNINISGTCKQSDNTTDCSDTGTIKVAINGALQSTIQNTVAGTWSISGLTQPAIGAVITVFVDGVTSPESRAVAVTTYDGSGDIVGLELIEGALSLGNSDNRTLTNSSLSQYDHSVSGDDDVFHDVNGANLIVDFNSSVTSELLYVKADNTFAPGGNVTTASYKNNGNFTAGTFSVAFNASSGTQTISGNLTSSSSFYKVSFDTGSSGTASWIVQNPMRVSATDAIDTFVIKNGVVTMGDSNGDNLEINGKVVIAGNGGETGSLETPALAQGNTIIIDLNNNISPVTCANCIISVGAASGSGSGSLKLKKNTILRLNPKQNTPASDTGVEVLSTGYLEILGSQEAIETVASLTQNTSNTTLNVVSPWTEGQFNNLVVRFTNPNSGSFGKIFDVTNSLPGSVVINAVTSPTDVNPQVKGSNTACSGNGSCTIEVADNLFTTSGQYVGNYLHNKTSDQYYLIAKTIEDVTDSVRIISNSPDDFTTMNDGDDVEITEGIRVGDSFEIIDYASVSSKAGLTCNSMYNQAGDAYIYAKAGSETLIRYADICNLGRGAYGKFGLFFESVNGANAGEGVTVDKSRIRKSVRGVNLINASANNSGKGVTNNLIENSLNAGVYMNFSSLNEVTSNRLTGNGLGIMMENLSNRNILADNYTSRSNVHGMVIIDSSNNKITGNTIYHNGTTYESDQGLFLLSGSRNNIIDSNHSFDNITWGIVVSQDSGNTTISNNKAHNNGKSGIVVEQFYNTIFKNKSFNNGFHGLTIVCSTVDNPTTILFDNEFYLNDKIGLMLESRFDCLATVINEKYGVAGSNIAADLYMGAAGAPAPGDHKLVMFNSTLASNREVGFEEMANYDYYAISKNHNGISGFTKIWGKYTVPTNNSETPQNESVAKFNFADKLWGKSASAHGYYGTGTQDSDLNYDLTASNLSGGPYHYRAAVKTAGDCSSAVFDILRNNVDIGDVACGVQFTDQNTGVKFQIDGGSSNAYIVGDTYTFNVWDGSNDANTQKTIIMMQDKGSFTVPSGATLELKGQPSTTNHTQITRSDTGGYQFTINGNLEAKDYQFDYLGGTGQSAGLILNNGATVTSLDNGIFNNFAVNNGTTNTFIQVNSALIGSGTPERIFSSLSFENATGHANCNLNSNGTTSGYWEFLLSQGSFGGEGFDCANGVPDSDPGKFQWVLP